MELCRLETRSPHCWEPSTPPTYQLTPVDRGIRAAISGAGLLRWGKEVVSPCLDPRSFTSKN